MEGLRYQLFYWSCVSGHKAFFWFNMIVSIEDNQRTDVCYKKFLGPDWEPTFDGAGIQISNHLSWIDIPVIIYLTFPSFVAKQETLNVPVIGKGSQIIQCLYLKRGDTKENRMDALRRIKERQEISEKSLAPPLHIFVEGCTTNGTKLIKFKRGAFDSLKAVKPIVLTYKTASWGMSPVTDMLGFGVLVLCSLCSGYIKVKHD
jgi:1-acyl-sn-glycerol-3-phosphate acyltransferase